MPVFDLSSCRQPVFFIGAGFSAESGVPTYRGSGGTWAQYDYRQHACQRAFEQDPERVLAFHELRRQRVLDCAPHAGHLHLAALQRAFPRLRVITQNIDGLLQRAGIAVDVELHGSLWRTRCGCGVQAAPAPAAYAPRVCPACTRWRRPDITWFEDPVDAAAFGHAGDLVAAADLFVSVGTSGVVYPAAQFIAQAARAGATMIEINPEATAQSTHFTSRVREPASRALPARFALPVATD